MINNALTSASSVSSYLDSLLAKAGKSSDNSTTTTSSSTASNKATQAAAKAALDQAASSFKSTTARQALEKQQAELADDLKAGLAKAGVTLEGPVEFSLDGNGELSIDGSDQDKAAATTFLKNNTQLGNRLANLAGAADALSGTIRQSAAISQAARYAGNASGVMSLYASLMTQQDTASAVFSFSGTSSSLTYPGVLASQA